MICRPGYSTIMDLAIVGSKALFIPTPGQTEQEYLAEYFMMRGTALQVKQNDICLSKNLPLAFCYKGFESLTDKNLYEQQVELLCRT